MSQERSKLKLFSVQDSKMSFNTGNILHCMADDLYGYHLS